MPASKVRDVIVLWRLRVTRSSWRAPKLPNLAVMDPVCIMRIVARNTEHHRADKKYDRQNERFRHDNLLGKLLCPGRYVALAPIPVHLQIIVRLTSRRRISPQSVGPCVRRSHEPWRAAAAFWLRPVWRPRLWPVRQQAQRALGSRRRPEQVLRRRAQQRRLAQRSCPARAEPAARHFAPAGPEPREPRLKS